jgi:tRNA threonylcarbamoyladenosine biosynthesis protein TsaB
VSQRRAIAIETSSRAGSIAIVEDGRVRSEEQFPQGLQHAAGVISIIDRLTRAARWTPGDLSEVYVSVGPGSFTGLRVGITVAKTLAMALGARVVAVPTAEVLVRNAPEGWQHAIIVLDAKRGQIFTARFENKSGEVVAIDPAHLDTLTNMLARSPRPVHLLGEGIPYHRQFLPSDPGVVITPEELWRPRAGVVAELGWRMSQAGEFVDVDKLTPLYIRRPEAEEKWEQLGR